MADERLTARVAHGRVELSNGLSLQPGGMSWQVVAYGWAVWRAVPVSPPPMELATPAALVPASGQERAMVILAGGGGAAGNGRERPVVADDRLYGWALMTIDLAADGASRIPLPGAAPAEAAARVLWGRQHLDLMPPIEVGVGGVRVRSAGMEVAGVAEEYGAYPGAVRVWLDRLEVMDGLAGGPG